ncbi:sugar phosphate isomerase/epimerase [Streptomyces sp. DSM 44917]|uniref:Sugar phosphate isomerase/epimerase n=1 Tax=Streptomyces boetiae TaxID=3075541 RepID=A0ABU2LEY0_9ACTN|nr:sugar phosphate isomerase/epimerase [Streptomyces sp. DSM 44917]MDT0310062.1 sugar phosphate isomerase/epimerase [Streptomyces sp. DSM 44917]
MPEPNAPPSPGRSRAGRRALLRGALAGAVAAAGGSAGGSTAWAGAAVGATAAAGAVPRRGRGLVDPARISVQLYTLRAALEGEPGHDATMRALARMGYRRVELAGSTYGRTAGRLRAFYDRLGIAATSAHHGLSAGPRELAAKLADAVTLGHACLVVPMLDSAEAADWRRWAARMNAEARAARSAGLRYGYHNHAHEWTRDLGGGTTPWEVLTAELDPELVHFELDLYWAATAAVRLGEPDPEGFAIRLIRAAPQRVRQYHVKDRDPATGRMADPGRGGLDFPRIFAAHAAEEYVVENDTPDTSPLRTARAGLAFLRGPR